MIYAIKNLLGIVIVSCQKKEKKILLIISLSLFLPSFYYPSDQTGKVNLITHLFFIIY